ncbi:glycosyltransferase family 87 protein [Neoroseomonas rubea]|uniref:glycosyltransferase family 87 protein n=1 Tax=Neoroseomonas rubea TaxID=2748666 RepID=UPI0018DF0CF6|nr:glycosyltransferase family 87 protein [Roseomonas rubea]
MPGGAGEMRWLTGARVALFGGAIVVFYLAVLFVGTLFRADGAPPTDFLAFHAAGRLALAGRAPEAYDWDVLQQVQAGSLAEGAAGAPYLAWLNPPHFFFLVIPFAMLPYAWGWLVWVLATGAVHAAAAWAVLGRPAAILAALAAPPVLLTASVGQNGLLTAGLIGLSFALMDRRPWAAGLALGLLTIKPQFGLLLPLILALTGRWRVFAAAAAVALAAMALSWLAFGSATWLAFLPSIAGNTERLLGPGLEVSPRIQSVFAFVARLTGEDRAAMLAHGMAALAAAALTLRLWLRRPEGPEEARAAAGIAAAYLMTPYVWGYDSPAIAIAVLFLARAGIRDGFLAWEKPLLLLACLWPALLVLHPFPLVMPLAWGLVLWLAWRRDRAWRLSPARCATMS